MNESLLIPLLTATAALTTTVAIALGLLLQKNKSRAETYKQQIAKLNSDLDKETLSAKTLQNQHHQQVTNLSVSLATLEAENKHLNAQVEQMRIDRGNMLQQFEQLATTVMNQQRNAMTAQNQETLKQLLEPMTSRLGEFSRQVADTYEKGLRDQIDLRAELKKLHEANRMITNETQSLVNALKNDNATQGSWGEVVLQRILERSGLTEGDTFVTQKQVTDDEGQRRRPDAVILLPDNKHLVIDAKVSLTAWEKLAASADAPSHATWLQHHTESVRRHITLLAQRDYPSLPGYNSPDFVILFMPVEAAFGAALQADPSLFQLAWDKKVVLTGPATLLATLRTVASVWRIENQNRNVLEIARQGGLLHDRLMNFASEMEKIGSQIDRLQSLWQKASDKLSTGKGNLIARASRLKQLGATTRSQNTITNPTDDDDPETDQN